jgi:hypothetical protein
MLSRPCPPPQPLPPGRQVLMEDGEVVECSRRIAAILYLTPGETGGAE